MKEEKQLKVSAIKNGTVIDHIPASNLFKVIEILALSHCKNQITFGNNLESKKLGSKAIIKIADRFFADDEVNRIALVAPQAKLNIIKNYNVIEKRTVEIPDEIHSIAKCMNPMCVTNHQAIPTKFKVISRQEVTLQCAYCEKITDQERLVILSGIR
ncbi:MAG: aspartate carbamoyltransferase regulatory subunit [Prevotellaceae bacterium]|jgi:aspartate carbamoyltransferase regulatory subunit|nr:aspartate carbamoyltransferase regulatory subunit [Prevotellaceae bacterium]